MSLYNGTVLAQEMRAFYELNKLNSGNSDELISGVAANRFGRVSTDDIELDDLNQLLKTLKAKRKENEDSPTEKFIEIRNGHSLIGYIPFKNKDILREALKYILEKEEEFDDEIVNGFTLKTKVVNFSLKYVDLDDSELFDSIDKLKKCIN